MLRRLGNVERGQRSSRRRVEVQIVYLAPRFGREDSDKFCGKSRRSSFEWLRSLED
jgi:hypothetical protein